MNKKKKKKRLHSYTTNHSSNNELMRFLTRNIQSGCRRDERPEGTDLSMMNIGTFQPQQARTC